jgi:iron complex outermembrane receptor protein
VPPSETRSWALFWIESAEWEHFRLDLGARLDDIDVSASPISAPASAGQYERSFSPLSASAALVWHVNDQNHLAVTLAHAERAPSDQELFAFGPHVATRTFEVGDAALDIESNRHAELVWRLHEGPVTGSLSIYQDDFDDYIYQADTGIEEDELPVRNWSQQDARFTGAELELRWDIGHLDSGHWQLFGFHDRVRARLDDDSAVPLIPPQRTGFGVDWDRQSWAGNITWIKASAHNDTAEFETPTPGYELLNAEVSYRYLPSGGGWAERVELEFFLRGHNLLDEEIRNSTSFLKDLAPQIGRNWIFGVRSLF